MNTRPCQKCRGLMVEELAVSVEEQQHAWQWACLNCGAREEPGHRPVARSLNEPHGQRAVPVQVGRPLS